ncbi:integrase [Burkholderia vietnamiensis]|uniref:integrase n=1 Tax=Burkholderia vietnamiensis TaxID=60552 RepID=UPI0015930052|nr:integrase [Burkholderia vietnamiensis]
MPVVNQKTSIILARLADLVGPRTPWNRSLWSVGTTFQIAELLDACSPPQAQTLSDSSQKNILEACKRAVGSDPVIDGREKGQLSQHLSKPPNPNGSSFHGLKELRSRIDGDYMLRWARLFHTGSAAVGAERAARSIATHLLDLGFSDSHLSQWLREKSVALVDEAGLAGLCEDAHRELVMAGEATHTLLFIFRTPMLGSVQLPPAWLSSSREVTTWLKGNGFATTGVRAPAGLTIEVTARDKFSALDKGWAIIDNYAARALIATGKPLEPLNDVWILGDSASPFRVSRRTRGVKIGVLHRQAKIFVETDDTNVDAAFGLLAQLEHSSPSAAIAGGWAAIESLLGEPGDRSAAADNLAGLVACSLPRAELTTLSYVVEQNDPVLRARLDGKSNRERAAIVGDMIRTQVAIPLIGTSDSAAKQRLEAFFRDPSGYLVELQRSISQAFHRLYRQRNHILHGGITSSIALPPTLRTTARLAGAGMDRVAHGLYADNLKPLELAARARIAIAMADISMSTDSLVSLLGT